MKSIVQSAYHDALSEMKKVLPERLILKMSTHKRQFFFLLLIPIVIELVILSGVYEIVFK